jgi:hypothetical protein
MKPRIWELTTTFEQSSRIVRRFRGESLAVGSDPRCDFKVPQPAPGEIFKISRVVADDSVASSQSYHCEVIAEGVEIFEKTWKPYKGGTFKGFVRLRAFGAEFEAKDLGDQRRNPGFEPERWAEQATSFESGQSAFWHIKDGLLVESILFKHGDQQVPLKCGYRVTWTPERPDQLSLVEYDGIPQNIAMTEGRGKDSRRAVFDDNIFILTRVPQKTKFTSPPVLEGTLETSHFKKTLMAFGATWLLVMSLMQLVPKESLVDTVALEQLSPELAKIVLEAPKPDGGNGQRGGGGNELSQNNDQKGGSGFEQQKMSESSGPDEVVVSQKGALAALTKVDKALGGGVLKAIEATGAIANALSALDEGVKRGRIKTASLGAVGGGTGKGSATGALGALAAIGGGGAAGGGVGIGGVGTKGFGGGGGGKGGGFGTGVGSGLGVGNGSRNVVFDSDNAAVQGGLERSEVEAVINENLSQIRYCYNKALRTNPNLAGKITSAFTISPDGRVKVSRVKESTLGNSEVEDCVKSRVASWQFPQPRGGGEVAVNYPFLLKAQ